MTYPTPYIDPYTLVAQPLPVSWSRIGGTNVTPNANEATLQLICVTATSLVNGEVGQMLRATVDTETLQGYGPRVGYEGPFARFTTSMAPILRVVSAQVAFGPPVPSASGTTSSFQWTPIPAGSAFPVQTPFNVYGSGAPGGSTAGQNAIYIDANYVPRGAGRQNTRVQVTYVNGWPHSGMTANAVVGATTIQVDDVTGWYNASDGTGAVGRIYDGAASEVVHCTAVSATTPNLIEPSGPGTLTLAAPLNYAHTALPYGPMVSGMPTAIIDATGLFAAAQGLRDGLAAVTVPSLPGSAGGGGTGGVEGTIEWLERTAAIQLNTYRRVIGT